MFPSKNNKTAIGLILVILCFITIQVAFKVKDPNYSGAKQQKGIQPSGSETSDDSLQLSSEKPIQPMNSRQQVTPAMTLSHRLNNIVPVKLTAYPALHQTGIIGLYDGKQVDNPADNVFTVRMDNPPSENDKVWLTYELTGLDDYTNVACSVNDRLAMGGYLARKDTGTHRQRVQLNAGWLQKGENRILFGIPENAGYGCKISDLCIEVEKGNNDSPLAVNSGTTLYNGKAYLHGFVQGVEDDKPTISIDGKAVGVYDGEFEILVTPNGKNTVEVTAEINGKSYSKEIRFNRNAQPDKEYALIERTEKRSKTFEKGKAETLQTKDAELKVDDKALLATQRFSLSSLRFMDLPALDMGMINVTDGHKGFRFLPHGEHFTEGATVALKYDRTKIPDGYTENDIKSFYFDNTTNHWIALERDTVDKALCMVVSKTTHFTDMINGVIKSPESPETQGFTPTMMNGIKAADPMAKIELITPPTANNTGSANLSYSLEMPPARNGMSPNLAIQYNSDGGSGWLGEGWDLNVPSITVDTRWGVPRYDTTKETETYSMGGTMLATTYDNSTGDAAVSHQGVIIESRSSDRQFYPRIEGSFSRIIRKGNTPSTYYWELTDKNGTIYTYGGNGAVLKGKVSNSTDSIIAEWKLKRVQEVHGDYTEYYYTIAPETVSGTVSATSIYLSKIETGVHNAGVDKVMTTVNFNNSATMKTKQTNNGRYGFLVSNNKLLQEIKINFEDTLLRSYAFSYKESAFSSTVLEKVTQKDNYGNEIASHTFDYYNDVQSGNNYNPYKPTSESWDLKSFKSSLFKNAGIINSSIASVPTNMIYTNNATALGASETKALGGSLYVGFGFDSPTDITNRNTAGLNVGLSASKTNGLSAFIDINGDGLPDNVYIKNNAIWFRPQINSLPGSFGDEIEITGPGLFSETTSTTITGGGEAKVGGGKLGLNIGTDGSSTYTKTPVYFLDVNNDGLIDIVSNGRVFFNSRDSVKSSINKVDVPIFTQYSRDTPNPITNVPGTTTNAFTDPPTVVSDENTDMIEATPLQDVVRVWKAPFDGVIDIDGSVQMFIADDYETLDSIAYAKSDGVRVAIQVGEIEKWSQFIPKGDATEYTPDMGLVHDILIKKGQKVYFRLQSGNDRSSNGDYDNVWWSPEIRYKYQDASFDMNGYNSTVYASNEGNLVSKFGYNQIDSGVPTVRISGSFNKSCITSDSVTLKAFISNDSLLVTKSGQIQNPNYQSKKEVYSRTFTTSTFNNELNFAIDNSVILGTKIRFEVSSKTDVPWDKISWNPQIHYSVNGRDTTIYAGVKYNIFSEISPTTDIEPEYNRVLESSGVTIEPFTNGSKNGNFTMVGSIDGIVFCKRHYSIVNNKCTSTDAHIGSYDHNNPSASDYIWPSKFRVDLYFDSETLPGNFRINVKDPISNYSETFDANIYCIQSNTDVDFGPMWRGWGQFEYNAADDRFGKEINESLLNLPKDSAGCKITKMAFFPMAPGYDPNTGAYWRGLNDYIKISTDFGNYVMSSGRLNMKTMANVNAFTAVNGSYRVKGIGAPPEIDEILDAPILQTHSTSEGAFGGASIVSGNVSTGTSQTLMAYMDMNGDGYPDHIINDKNTHRIDYSNSRGYKNGDFASILPTDINRTECSGKGIGLGGGIPLNRAISPTTLSTRSEGADAAASASSTLAQSQTSLSPSILSPSISAALNTDDVTATFSDINGDGLPDKIFKENGIIKVSLNLGYSFSDPMVWGIDNIQSGKSISGNAGLGLGIDYGNGSFKLGFGIAATWSETTYTLMDVNGDGLPDKVWNKDLLLIGIGSSSTSCTVAFNLGNRFSDPIPWSPKNISSSVSTSESLNAAVTLNVNIFGAKLSITPSTFASTTINRPTYDMRDVDGDGYPDVVSADFGSSLIKVQRSTIGCTNKLKSVYNSLGGSFTIDYERSKSTYDHPGGKWVMDSVIVNDGIGSDGPLIKTAFEYSGGRRDRAEREFIGFAKVIIKNIDTENKNIVYRITSLEFSVANIYEKGDLLRTLITDGSGKKYHEISNVYDTYLITKPTNSNLTYDSKEVSSRYSMPYIQFLPLQSTKTIVFGSSETDSLVTSLRTYKYFVHKHNDSSEPQRYGDLKSCQYSDKVGSIFYNYVTDIVYTSDETRHILSLPTEVTVRDVYNNVCRHVRAYYEDPANRTHLTNIVQYLNSTDSAVTTFKYDYSGNIIHKVLPSKMSYTYNYDTRYNMYPTQIKDTFGYVSKLDNYNYKYGIPCKATDENGNVMNTMLDNLGRVSAIQGPNEIANGKAYTMKFEYHPRITKNTDGSIDSVAYALTNHYDPSNPDNDLETATFVDGFGRAIQVKKDCRIGNGSSPRMIVNGRTKFDAFGRVKEVYYPITEVANTTNKIKFNPLFDTQPPTKTTYDVLDRVLSTTSPDGNSTTMSYALDSGYLKTTVTDALGGSQATYTNGSGLTVKTKQYSGPNGQITTKFDYDAINQLISVTDAKNQVTSSVYDIAGRRTQVTHPASGTTLFEYDVAGNLLTKQTANLKNEKKKIVYTYDYNRLKTITYPDHPENNVTYTYGASGASDNRVGRLVYQEDGSGCQEFKYGRMGEVTELRRTMVIPNQAVATYVTRWTYDSWDRVQTMTYPDGEMLTYTYSLGGLLTGITGTKGGYRYPYVSNIVYNKFEQRTSMQYGNGANDYGAITAYTYNPLTLQLSNLKVFANNKMIMNNAYTFDKVNNVTDVLNTAVTSASGLGGTMEHHYSYDGLYRLTGATGVYNKDQPKEAHYNLAMTYDNMHNVMSKKQKIDQTGVQFDGSLYAGYNLAYHYTNNSQQISNIADTTYRYATGESQARNPKVQQYGYDANGNQISILTSSASRIGNNSRKMLWDEENRLLALSDNGFVSNYFYDASGERTVKMSGDNEGVSVNGVLSGARTGTTNFTAYISPYLVVNNGGYYTKHIYMDSQRIVSELGSSDIFTTDNAANDNKNPIDAAVPKAGGKDFTVGFAAQTEKIKERYDSLGVVYKGKQQGSTSLITPADKILPPVQYFFHSD
ncbi:MAG: SpvB/TcaC N-terminal domain-containing protein, partial [Bacteroidota bacterium]|nr:SpvB/TcaC N-terminal domain-containing protein [Bacteroidota bacterium]